MKFYHPNTIIRQFVHKLAEKRGYKPYNEETIKWEVFEFYDKTFWGNVHDTTSNYLSLEEIIKFLLPKDFGHSWHVKVPTKGIGEFVHSLLEKAEYKAGRTAGVYQGNAIESNDLRYLNYVISSGTKQFTLEEVLTNLL